MLQMSNAAPLYSLKAHHRYPPALRAHGSTNAVYRLDFGLWSSPRGHVQHVHTSGHSFC